ncbi:MAG: hypothetical protein Q8N23_02600 [Archangium sp.]|nr:hypothetical protein [Archangium sp.]MDP3573961.1 hypothetical protein [Archangium sp.]
MRSFVLLLLSFGLTACCIQLPPPRPEPLKDEDGGVLGTPLWPEGSIVFGTTDGTGEVFIPIGTELELHRGPQGGYHAYAKYQVSGGQFAQDVVFEHRVRRVRDNVLVSRGSRNVDVTAADGGVWMSEGAATMFLCPTAPGVSIVGEPLNFEVTVMGNDRKFYGRTSVTATLACAGCEADCGG